MRSILGKILVYLGGAVLLAVLTIGVVTTSFVSKTVIDDENVIMQDDSQKTVYQISNYFTRYINMMQQMARDKNVVQLLSGEMTAETYQQAPNYAAVYNTLQATGAEDAENILTAYVVKNNVSGTPDFAFDNGEWLSDTSFDLDQKGYWFKEQAQADKGFIICEPYVDVSTGNIVTTVSAPVYNEAHTEIVGIVAVDIKVTTICDMVTNTASTYNTGYRILVSEENTVLAHKNADSVLKKYNEIGVSDALLSAIDNVNSDITAFNDGETDAYAVVAQEQESGWKVVNIVPKAEYKEATSNIVRTILLINGVAMLAILIIMSLLAKSISNPLKKLTQTTDKLAAGDLDVSLDVRSKDEVGRLGQSMNVLVERLRTYIAYIEEVSDLLTQMGRGDLNLTFIQSYDGDFRRIKDALVQASDMLSDTLAECNTAAEQVSSGSEQVAVGAQALSQGTTEQASSIEELSATIGEVSVQIQEAAENARKARAISIEANTATEYGQQQMEKMVDAMNEISKTSTEIGKIIKNIDDIAFQTNILALNAAVEAARAGAAGKGFAVVADEVRNLAGKSAESAKSTALLIDNALRAISNGTAIVSEAAKSLEEVVADSKRSVQAIEEIADSADKQALSITQINQGIEQISAVVQTNSATAEESAAASEELSSQAQMFKDLIGRFTLKKQQGMPSVNAVAEPYEREEDDGVPRSFGFSSKY